jgi:Radical SAM superfamily
MKNFEFDITYNCNLACKWCNKLCGTEFGDPVSMSPETIRKYCNMIIEHVGPHSRIAMVGGEPTLHPQIFEILDIVVEVLRPQMKVPILILSNGVGEKVNSTLSEIRARYTTVDTELTQVTSMRERPEQFFIVCSKKYNPSRYVKMFHSPIYRAAIDTIPERDFAASCWVRRECGYGITPYGIYPCTASAPFISKLFNIPVVLDHLPTLEEEKEQLNKICKYCYVPVEKIVGPEVSPTYEKKLKEWSDENR